MGVVETASAGVGVLLLALMIVESRWPARDFPSVPGWRRKCLVFMPMIIAISSGLPLVFEEWLRAHRLVDGSKLGIVGGTCVGIFVSEFLVYWAHRWHHRFAFLWRWIHQLHHSAERVDVFGAAYFHPLEILEGTVVGLALFSLVLGLSPEAAGLSILWQGFQGIFQHGNIRTPRWLGYLMQRPEQHALHHERGVHGYNYANLSLWDLVFGTFRNPASWQGQAGFYEGASSRTWEMLCARDASKAEAASEA